MFRRHFTAIFSILLTFFMVFNACKKEQSSTPDVPPTITSTSPSENDQLANGQVLNVKGTVTDPTGLASLVIKITDDDSKKEIYKDAPVVTDLTTFNIDSKWTISVNDWLTTTMTITAINKKGLKTEKQIHFKIWL